MRNKSKFLTFFFAIFVPQTLLAAYPPNSSGHYLQLDAVQSIYNQKLLVSKEFIEEGDPDLYLIPFPTRNIIFMLHFLDLELTRKALCISRYTKLFLSILSFQKILPKNAISGGKWYNG